MVVYMEHPIIIWLLSEMSLAIVWDEYGECMAIVQAVSDLHLISV